MGYLSNDFFQYYEMAKEKALIPNKQILTPKQGKQPRAYLVIKEMGDSYSETAKYVAQLLSNNTTWKFNSEEILGMFESKSIFPSKYHSILKPGGDKKLSDAQRKEKAKEIFQSAMELYHKQNSEISKTLEGGAKKGNFAFASELFKTSSNVETDILRSFKIFQQIAALPEEQNNNYTFDQAKFLDYKANGSETTTNFMNRLVGRVSSELRKILGTFEFNERTQNTIQSVADGVQKANKDILWPESDHDILDLAHLEKYFRMLRSSQEMKRGEKILTKTATQSGYKKKGRVQSESPKYEQNFKDLIKEAVKETQGVPSNTEDLDKKIHELAKSMLKNNRWLKQYMIDMYDMDKEADIDEVEDELASQIAYKR